MCSVVGLPQMLYAQNATPARVDTSIASSIELVTTATTVHTPVCIHAKPDRSQPDPEPSSVVPTNAATVSTHATATMIRIAHGRSFWIQGCILGGSEGRLALYGGKTLMPID